MKGKILDCCAHHRKTHAKLAKYIVYKAMDKRAASIGQPAIQVLHLFPAGITHMTQSQALLTMPVAKRSKPYADSQ